MKKPWQLFSVLLFQPVCWFSTQHLASHRATTSWPFYLLRTQTGNQEERQISNQTRARLSLDLQRVSVCVGRTWAPSSWWNEDQLINDFLWGRHVSGFCHLLTSGDLQVRDVPAGDGRYVISWHQIFREWKQVFGLLKKENWVLITGFRATAEPEPGSSCHDEFTLDDRTYMNNTVATTVSKIMNKKSWMNERWLSDRNVSSVEGKLSDLKSLLIKCYGYSIWFNINYH